MHAFRTLAADLRGWTTVYLEVNVPSSELSVPVS